MKSNLLKLKHLGFQILHVKFIMLNETKIKFVESPKHLGVINCPTQLESSHKKFLLPKNAALKACTYERSRTTSSMFFTVNIRSICHFSVLNWDSFTEEDSDKLEKLQYNATRIVTGFPRFSNAVRVWVANIKSKDTSLGDKSLWNYNCKKH